MPLSLFSSVYVIYKFEQFSYITTVKHFYSIHTAKRTEKNATLSICLHSSFTSLNNYIIIATIKHFYLLSSVKPTEKNATLSICLHSSFQRLNNSLT